VEWQVNTATGGDFGTVLVAFRVSDQGTVSMPRTLDLDGGLVIGSLTPPTGPAPVDRFVLWVDPGDHKLKAVGSSGVSTILALP
jgi:hypothetical protein